MICCVKMLKEKKMPLKENKVIRVPESWLERFQDCVEALSKTECYCSDLEDELDSMIECIMAQGKMLEEAGKQPLTPDIFISMIKGLDAKERDLSKREKAFKNQFGGMVPRDKKDWN